MASDNCAVGPDGQLLDASKITWYNDPDDDIPMAPMTATLPSMVQGPSVTTLDSFVTKVAPAAHRSACAPRPSAKVIDPDNAMTLKCKASNTGSTNPSRRRCQASPESESEEATEPDPTPTDTEDEPDPTDIEDDDEDLIDPNTAYEESKVLGDADREVRVHFFSYGPSLTLYKAMGAKTKDDCTADVCTIFKKVKEKIHPKTGKKIAKHCCLVCRYTLILELNKSRSSDIFLRDKGAKTYFFTGGVSSLRTHISRYSVL